MCRKPLILTVLILCFTFIVARAASLLPITPEEQAQTAQAIFRGPVVQLSCFRDTDDGAIYTRATFRVDEPLKGKFGDNVQVVFRGGSLNGKGEVDSSSPRLVRNQEHIVFLQRRADGTLSLVNGIASCILLDGEASDDAALQSIRQLFPTPAAVGEDVSDQSASTSNAPRVIGGLMESNGASARFIAPDHGEAIPYIVDTQALPSGISVAQALTAVSNAFKAWSDVSSVKFVYEGTQNFGQAAPNVNTDDRKIRVQLHDLYGFIPEANVLGKGGRVYSIPGVFPNGGNGGKVGNKEFYESTRGYVVLKHTAASMQNVATFTEVLCHEIGHVLSLDHSSETYPEANETLREATMYFQIHGDGRAATLGSYDPPIVRLVHPFNTPPYVFDRVVDLVTAPTTPNVAGINEIELRQFDLQNDALTVLTTNAVANNCTFAVVGDKLKVTPNAYYGDSTRINPSSGSYFDRIYVRFMDASNASPYMLVRTISFASDSQPANGSDGLPDSWMTQHFGTTIPSAGSKTRAQDDYDNDGVSNLNEFIAGASPVDANSAIKLFSFSGTNLQWMARAYDLYEVQHSTDFTSWTRATTPKLVTSSTGSAAVTNSVGKDFFRIERVP